MRTAIVVRKILVGTVIVACVFVLFSVHPAAADPGKVPAGKMTPDPSQLGSPGRLAVDSEETLYVVDGYKNRVRKFSAAGAYLGSIKVSRPSAVAVAPDGKLYVGSHDSYSVGIYRNGEMTGSLGAGGNEFSSISDIAVDKSTGDIYVVDTKKNTVKVYDPAGAAKGELSGFTAPAAVAVTDTEVTVLDSPEAPCPDTIMVEGKPVPCPDCTGPCSGSRISVVDKTGKPLRSVTESGNQNNAMVRPVALAADALGNIYVADTLRKAIIVYDRLCTVVGEMTSAQGDLHAPVSLTLSRDGSLYVSSSETRSIVEIGLAGALRFTPTGSLDFKSKTGLSVGTPVY